MSWEYCYILGGSLACGEVDFSLYIAVALLGMGVVGGFVAGLLLGLRTR